MAKDDFLIILAEAMAYNKLMASETNEPYYFARLNELEELENEYNN